LPPASPPENTTTDPVLATLTGHADTLRQAAVDAGLAHAEARHQLAARYLRSQWPTAATVDADLSRQLNLEGNPEVRAIMDADGRHLWSREFVEEAIDEAEYELSTALDFADHVRIGWVRIPTLGVGMHRLTLPNLPESHPA
jgi:hypothetical protein